jgi:hypothetical protein
VAATAARLVKSSAETSASGFESVDITVKGPPGKLLSKNECSVLAGEIFA